MTRFATRARRASFACACFIGLSTVATPAFAQDAASRPESSPAPSAAITPESAAEALLGDRAVVRKKASAWILENAEAAVPALVKALETPPATRFSFDGIRATGAFKDRRVSIALMKLLDRPEFRWRPQAFESLADHGTVDALARFVAATNEPTWRARAAACRGIAALRSKEHAELCRALLDDEESAVRLEAAKALWSFGDVGGLAHVVRDLSLDRRFFESDVGALARDAAATFLNEVIGEAAFPVPCPVHDFPALRVATARVKAALKDRGAAVQDVVPPHDPDATDLPFAIEARSCVEGDLHLRFNAEGEVVTGRDQLVRSHVAPAATKELARLLESFDHGPRGRRIVGPIACDFERVGGKTDGAWRSTIFGENKRPPELAPFEAALEAVVKQALGEPYAAVHAVRARRYAAPEKEASK